MMWALCTRPHRRNRRMDFGDAIHVLRQGGIVRRAGWRDALVFLADATEFHTDADLSFLQGRSTAVGEFLVYKDEDDVLRPGWVPSQEDMLADDWIRRE